MKLFGIFQKLAHDCGLDNEQDRIDLNAKINTWVNNSGNEEATKIQKFYTKIHANPLLEVLAPFIYIILRQWFNGILNGESGSEDERRLDERYH
jgi:hypothetical protein